VIPLLRAFAWLRWREFLNSFRGTRRRDALERGSRALSALVPIVLAVLFVPGLTGLGALALVAGYLLGGGGGADPDTVRVVQIVLGAFLATITIVVLVAPMARAISRRDLSLTRLLLLPIPRPLLHLLDLAAGVMDPWIALVVPVVLLLPAGLAAAGAPGSAAVALVAGIVLLVFYLALGSCVSHVLSLLYRDRRRGELASLLILVSLSMIGFVPALIGERHHGERDGRGRAEPSIDITRFAPTVHYTRAIEPRVGRASARALSLGSLALITAALYGISWSAYRRLLDSPQSGPSRRARAPAQVSRWRIPGIGPEAAAVASARMKLSLRTIQGKMAVFYTPVGMLVAAVAMARLTERGLASGLGPHAGPILAAGAALLALLSMQNLLLNQFAADGAGLTLQLLAPISGRDIVVGNAVGLGLFFGGSTLFYLAVSALFVPDRSPWLWVASFLLALSAYLVFSPVAALLSALFPKVVDLGRIGSASNPSPAASLLGLLLALLAAAPPVLLGALGLVVLDSARLTLALLAGWTLFAAALSVLLVRLAAVVLTARRENLAIVAAGR
jgi:hypothetical protein